MRRIVTTTRDQDEVAIRLKDAYDTEVSRWVVPKDRLKDDGKAGAKVGALELWLFLQGPNGKAAWEKVVVQQGGHVADIEHRAPYNVPTPVG